MSTWKIRLTTDGGNFITVDTRLINYHQAIDHCKSLYGPGITIVGHDFNDGQEQPRRRGWLW